MRIHVKNDSNDKSHFDSSEAEVHRVYTGRQECLLYYVANKYWVIVPSAGPQDRGEFLSDKKAIALIAEAKRRSLAENPTSRSISLADQPHGLATFHPDIHTRAETPGDFHHSRDFRCVSLRGKKHSPTFNQAQVLEYLWKESQRGVPEVSVNTVLADLDIRSESLYQVFKSRRESYSALIVLGRSKGTVRLNL